MSVIDYKDYHQVIPKDIYSPLEDTYLMLSVLKNKLKIKKDSFLEVGSGNGLIMLEMYDFFNNLTVVDIDPKVIIHLKNIKKKFSLKNLKIIKSDLFSKIENEKFDVIVFNPPYVPSEKIEFLSTDGGKEGLEVIVPFLKSLKKHLNKKGVCYLLISSHNNLRKIYKTIKESNLKYKKIIEKNIFFEKLIVIEICEK